MSAGERPAAPKSQTALLEVGGEGQILDLRDRVAVADEHGVIRLHLSMEKPTRFPIYFRIPNWADNAEIAYHGKKIIGPAGTLFKMEQTWQPDTRS